MRPEADFIGQVGVPGDVHWGAQIAGALGSLPASGAPISQNAYLPTAFSMVKVAATRAITKLGKLDCAMAAAEIITGRWHDQFSIDVPQGGAGTRSIISGIRKVHHLKNLIMAE